MSFRSSLNPACDESKRRWDGPGAGALSTLVLLQAGNSVCVLQTEDYLKHKIRSRPERSDLVNMHILQGKSFSHILLVSPALALVFLLP